MKPEAKNTPTTNATSPPLRRSEAGMLRPRSAERGAPVYAVGLCEAPVKHARGAAPAACSGGSKARAPGRARIPARMPNPVAWRPSRVIVVVALTVAALLPFLGKPFSIDDPLFLWSAAQIAHEPFDFYGAAVNWYGTAQPLYTITKNPPLVCYGIAAVSQLVGSSERALHAAFLAPAVAATAGTWFLAARLGAPPTLAALALLASPVFLASATSVMCDVPMLACFVWAIFFWVRGLEDGRTRSLFLAGALIAAAALSKYFGMALLPLLALFALWRERRAGVWCLALVVPVVVLAAYQWATHDLYGRGLLSDAAQYAVAGSAERTESSLLVGLAFTGACAATLAFFLPFLISWRWLAGGLAMACALGAALAAHGSLGGYPLRSGEVVRWGLVLQIALHAAVGLAALGLAVADFARRRSADAALLLAWVLGTFVFATFVNWTINARSVLPLMPALAIGIARRLAERGASPAVRFLPLVPAALLSLVVAWGDQELAETARRVPAALRTKYADRLDSVWFQGHWGFQYYMAAHGFRALDLGNSKLPVGQLVVQPGNNTNVFPLPKTYVRLVGSLVEPPHFVAVMDRDAGAGFYTSLWGPLPYAFGGARPDRTTVLEVIRPLAFQPSSRGAR